MEFRKESEPHRPTFMTEGGAMLVLQYFCNLVTRQVKVALTSAGPAVHITCGRKFLSISCWIWLHSSGSKSIIKINYTSLPKAVAGSGFLP